MGHGHSECRTSVAQARGNPREGMSGELRLVNGKTLPMPNGGSIPLIPTVLNGLSTEESSVEYKQLQCAEHGGVFRIPRKAGRPPTKCNAENPCDMSPSRRKSPAKAPVKSGNRVVSKENTATASQKGRPAPRKGSQAAKRQERTEEAKPATRTRPAASDVTVRHNPSVVMAKRAKDQLEPQEWNLKGRAWIDEDDHAWAEVTGSRGEETIAIRWVDGKFDSQDYSLWDADKTPGQQSGNPMPKTRLPFDPNEMTDDELAKELGGRTVTWWNKLGGSTETAIIGDKLKIEHTYTGGNETARQIHFVDKTPNHYAFRAFNVDALMRVK